MTEPPSLALHRRTKIVCTLGPASSDDATIRLLIANGMNTARINMSHGDHDQHRAVIGRVRAAGDSLGIPIGIIADLQGPKIRTGELENPPALLATGATFTLTTEQLMGDAHRVSVDYAGLPGEVSAGDRILLGDGALELMVLAATADAVHTEVVHGGLLAEHQGISVPSGIGGLPSLTEKDLRDLRFALDMGVEYVAQSFVRRASDVRDTKRLIAAAGGDCHVIAKIEKPQALYDLEDILDESDGVMVARGDLGVELPPEEVPLWQKRIIARAAYHLVPVITATQMLESMIHSVRPTRAEASDVANAIWDGTDAVMLSAETAVGEYPAETVAMMDRIIRSAESASRPPADGAHHIERPDYSYDIARAARQIAETNPEVRAIVAFTSSGYTARLISKERPPAPVLVLTPDERVMRRCSLFWGVTARECRMLGTLDEMVTEVDHAMRSRFGLREGETVVLVGSLPVERVGITNFLKLHRVGEVD